MVIVRSPLRVTLGGGGTDLPYYANVHGGFCITAAIDQYVYVSVMRPFEPGIYLKYSEQERVSSSCRVAHPIIRETLCALEIKPQIEITTLADVPAGTGLGSSSSFTTALLQALTLHTKHHSLAPHQLAELACQIEINRLCAPIGKQDQYAAAYGGLTSLTIGEDGAVQALPLPVSRDTLHQLEDSLLLFFTCYSRSANAILSTPQDTDRLHRTKERGMRAHDLLVSGELRKFGELMDAHWQEKRQSQGMSNSQIDTWYALAKKHGAIGGKLVGAGGGGCLLFYTESPRALRAGLKDSGLEEIRFRFDCEGTKAMLTA